MKEDIESSYVEKRYVDSIRRSISSSSERYHGLIVGKRNTDDDKKKKEKSNHYPKPARKRTQVSAAGRWLGKQYKKGIDLLLNPENLKTRSYDDYKNVFQTIFDTIQTIFYNQKKDGFLNHEYIIDIKLKYADFMLDKAKDDPIFADMDFLTSFVLLSIIEKEKYYPSENGDERVNRLLYKLNKLSNVRESFMDYVDEINLQSILYEDVPDDIEDDKLKMYLDQKSIEFNQFGYNKLDTLFGYKTKEQMELFFKSRYGDNAEFIVGNNDIEVFAMMDTLNFKKAYTLADNDVKTINKFISGYRLPIKRILFTFRNIDDLSRIVFKMKTDGRIAYQVERTLETKDKSTTLPCKKGENSKTWVLDFERIYK